MIVGSVVFIAFVLVVGALSFFLKPKIIVLVLHILLPLVLFLFGSMEGFVRMKIGTLVFGAFLYAGALFMWVDPTLVMVLFLWLLRLNIFEAIITDIVRKKYLSAISGSALLLATSSMAFLWDGVAYRVDQPLLALWALAYTVWNLNFILGYFGMPTAIYHVAILSAPWIGVFIMQDLSLWVLMRGFTLNTGATAQVLFQQLVVSRFTHPATERLSHLIMGKRVQATLMVGIVAACTVALLS